MPPSANAIKRFRERCASWLLKLGNRNLHEVLGVFFVRGLGAISMFLLYALVARQLPIDEAGHLFVGLGTLTILMPISAFGLHSYSLRMIGARTLEEHADEIRFVARKTLWWAVVCSTFVAVALYLLAPWLANRVFAKPELASVFAWIAPGVVFGCMATVLSGQLQGIRRFSAALTVLSIATPLVTAVVISSMRGLYAEQATKALLAGTVCSAIIGLGSWRFYCPPGPRTPVDMSDLVQSCIALGTVNTMIVIVNWSGQVVAGVFAEASDVAVFSVAQRTANLVNFILIGVNFVVTPRFARLWAANDMLSLRALAMKSTAWMSVVALPMVILIAIFPHRIMGMFGPEFERGAMLLVILAIGQAFNVVTGSVNALLNMCGFEADLRNIVLTSGLVAIVLSLIMTSLFGVLGSALAITITLIIQNTLAVAAVKRRLGFSMFASFSVLRASSTRPAIEGDQIGCDNTSKVGA